MSQLARASGVDLATISRLEAGKRYGASYETILRLAHALGVEPQQLQPVRLLPGAGAPVLADAGSSAD